MQDTFQWTDDVGREWGIKVTLGMRNRVLADAEFDMFDPQQHVALALDPSRIGTVLYAIHAPQIEEQSLTPEQFVEGLDGDALNKSIAAFHEALAVFFRQLNPSQGALFEKALSSQEDMLQMGAEKTLEMMGSPAMMETVSAEMDTKMKEALDHVLKM